MEQHLCEVCGKEVGVNYLGYPRFHYHHWRGYDYPDDLWALCQSCNMRLAYRHDGSLTIEEARVVVTLPMPERMAYVSENDPNASERLAAYQERVRNRQQECSFCGQTCRTPAGLASHMRLHGIDYYHWRKAQA